MSNPDGLALFARRPPSFDEILVKAVQKGLPIPLEPDDICQEWVDMTRAILTNNGPGAFVSPKCPVSRTATFSQIFVVKLPRLKTLDLTSQDRGPKTDFMLPMTEESIDVTNTLSQFDTPRKQHNLTQPRSVNSSSRHSMFERSPNVQLNGARAHVHSSRLCDNRDVSPNTASTMRDQSADINELETAPQSTSIVLTQSAIPASPTLASPTPLPVLEERSLASPAQNGASLEPLTTPQPRKRGRPKKSINTRDHSVHIAKLGVPATTQSQEQSRPRNVAGPEASILQEADPSPPNNPGLESEGVIEPSAEKLGKGVTTRSGRELPRPLSIAPRPTLGLQKRRGESTSAKSQNKKRKMEGESPALASSPTQPPETVSPTISSLGRAHLQATSEIIHENSGQIAPPISNNDEASATQQSEPIPSELEHPSLPVPTEIPFSFKEAHTLEETEPDRAVLREEPHRKGEVAPLKERLLGTQGGTVALTRRNIIMSVIEQCHGAVPDGPPLQFGFVTKWRSLGHQGLPDNRTIETTVRALIAIGKAKRLVFASSLTNKAVQSKHSMLVGPDMLVAPVNTDKVVTTLRERMAANAPDPYFPEDLDWDQALKKEKHRPVAGRKRGIADIDEALETVSDTIPAAVRMRNYQQRTASLKRRRTNQHQAALRVSKRTNRQQKLVDDLPSSKITETQQPLRLRPGVIQMRGPLKLSDKTREALRTYYPVSGDVLNDFSKPAMHLPTSLADILRDGTRGPRTMSDKRFVLDYNLFCSEVDRVQRWESRRSDLFNVQSNDWRFINHHIASSFLQIDSSEWQLQFQGLTKFDETGIEYDDKADHSSTPVGFDFPTPEQLLSSERDQPTLPPYHPPPEHPGAIRNMGPGMGLSLTVEARVASRDSSGKTTQVEKNAAEQRYEEAEKNRQEKAGKRQEKARKRQEKAEKRREKAEKKQEKAEKRQEKAEGKIQQKAEKKRQKELQKAASSKKRRKKTSKLNLEESNSSLIGSKKARGPQFMRHLSASQVYKIAVAIIVVRTLTGGIERQIDWPVVMRCLPNKDEDFIKERWKTITNKYRQEIDELSDMFTGKYLKAYERDEVPLLDFDNLQGHDWDGLVDWAMKSLREPETEDLPDLPSSRHDLEQRHSLHVNPCNKVIRSTFNLQSNVSVPAKELAMAAAPFGIAYPPTPDQNGVNAADELNIAKTWHRATIVAEDRIDSRAAAAKFNLIPNEIHNSALRALIDSQTLAKTRRTQHQEQKAKKLGFHSRFHFVLGKQRIIEVDMLRRAAWFKTDVLDPNFAARKPVGYEPGVTVDGDMLAIINLVAQGRVKLVPVNEPCDRYGLIRSYKTRDIPKEKFRFQVDVLPVEGAYVFGFPVAEALPPLPRGGVDDEKGLIPLWLDIHGRVDQDIWQTVVTACVGLIALRPGIGVEELVEMLMPALEVQDVELVVQWLGEGGFVKRTAGGGCEAEEWWWAVLSGDKGKRKAK